jgi:hypothetical protein
MACPHVSGTAALVLDSGWVNDTDGQCGVANEVRTRLQKTADDPGAEDLDEYYGHGILDAEEAATGNDTNP